MPLPAAVGMTRGAGGGGGEEGGGEGGGGEGGGAGGGEEHLGAHSEPGEADHPHSSCHPQHNLHHPFPITFIVSFTSLWDITQ